MSAQKSHIFRSPAMIQLLQSLNAFGQASSAPLNFRDMCRAFDSDYEALSRNYDAVKNNLQALYTSPCNTNPISPPSVSDYAKDERRVLEFCLARLLELQDSGVRHTPAVEIILDEVEQVIWDDNNFHSTVPDPSEAAKVFNSTFTERWEHTCHIANLAGEKLSAIWDRTFKFAKSSMRYLGTLYAERMIIRGMCNLLTSLLVAWVLFCVIFLVLQLMVGEFIGMMRSMVIPQNSGPGERVHFPSTPIHEGVYRAAQSTIYMSDLAGNYSMVPDLLQHSRNNILSAADIIAGSKLESKDILAPEYSKLVVNMEELTGVSRKWHILVDALATEFENLLSNAIMQVSTINRPTDFSSSVPVSLSLACTIQWMNNPGLHRLYHGRCMVCGVLVATTVVSSVCLEASSGHIPSAYCSPWLKYVPGLQQYLNAIAEARVKAVRKLRRFLESLDVDMRELLDNANRGAALCELTEQNFRQIRKVNIQSNNDIQEQLQLIHLRKWQLKAWLAWSGMFEEQDESQAVLHVKHYNLNQTISLHGVAFEFFSRAKGVLLNLNRGNKVTIPLLEYVFLKVSLL
ncbi:hypothetical protein DL98DRAFT_221110 [Cadophora sp. DSE1049]|nr:hypothetical protein DL98DRAFT_221110 [Cadophora sp. DSE1049]